MKHYWLAAPVLSLLMSANAVATEYHETEFADQVRVYPASKVEKVLKPTFRRGLVRHIVLFDLKKGITEYEKDELIQRILELRASARDEQGAPYIQEIEVGDGNISREGLGQGYDLVFTVTFASVGDRNFYVGQDAVFPRASPDLPFDESLAGVDQVHAAFKNFAGPLLNASRPDGNPPVIVFDYRVAKKNRP